jgi:hypothetical protein
MTEQYEAVRLILDRLKNEGLEWFRNAREFEDSSFENRVSGNFQVFEGGDIHTIGNKMVGSFPEKKILIMKPSRREVEAVLGLWLSWNFDGDPIEFRLFIGQWAKIGANRKFTGFRFETPEQGEEHDYYHCQPCRNLGDRVPIDEAVDISENFPTIPLNASNIVELTLCAIMATMGRKMARKFIQRILVTDSSPILNSAYSRCCKESYVDFRTTAQ